MPSLRFSPGPDRAARHLELFKRITTLGRAPDNDVALDDPAIPDCAAHIHFDGKDFTLACLEGNDKVRWNGAQVRRQRLSHGDRIQLGSHELVFLLYDEPAAGAAPDDTAAEIRAYRKMVEFSARLSGAENLDRLLEALLDAVIELTRADKGMVILLQDGELRVRAARNLKHETIEDAGRLLSDSIISRVVQNKRPLIVSDALNDEAFRSALSVVNLKLCSVMAAPLMEKGELFGLLYVGNDNVVNLFEERSLDVLTVFAAQASLLLRNAMLLNELRLDNQELSSRLEKMRFGEIIGSSEAMREVYRKIEKVAPTDIAVLVSGETGTGKELVARRIHELSPRGKGPFVTINCGAIPENLLESELFGHVRGAFTGAVATRPGKFQAASGGTLFLDEIGELPLQLQVKLLRALQEHTVTKVGDTRPERVDIRVLTATHKDLEEEIRQGRFREDLFYRINVVSITLPPLRERGDDVLLIAKFLLQKFATEFGSRVKGFSPAAVSAMRGYAWPGNIREMENRLKKAVVLAERAHIGPEDLDLQAKDLIPILPLAEAKEQFQRRYIDEVLRRNNGNRTKTARDLGVDPRTIFRHLEKKGEEEGEEEQKGPEA